MTKKPFSRLNLLFDRFNVTGKELASALHVDHTLVSKWRNSTRVLRPQSTYLKKIVEYFVALDSSNQYIALKEILLEAYPNVSLETSKEIHTFLKKWLSDNRDSVENNNLLADIMNNKNVNRENFYVFKDNEGRRQAIIKFLDIALTSPEGQELVLFSQENPSWFYEDKEFLNVWREKNLEFLNKEGKISIIHTFDRLYKSIASSLVLWMPLHMTGNTTPYYYPEYLGSQIKVTVFLAKGKAAIFSITSEGLTKTMQTYLCTDPITLQQCQFATQILLNNSQLLFERILPHQTKKMIETLIKSHKLEENGYYVTSPPFFSAMSSELFRSILVENGFSDELINLYMGYQATIKKQFTAHSSKYYYRLICNISKIDQALESEDVILEGLSILTGLWIKVKRKTFCQCIEELIAVMEEVPNLEVALTEEPPFAGFSGINMWVKQNAVAVSSNLLHKDKKPFTLLTKELTSVNSSFHNFTLVWNGIPKINRDKEWVKERLLSSISRLQSIQDR